MGNSSTRARARRNKALSSGIADALRANTSYRLTVDQERAVAASVRARLRAEGLEVTDIGGQRVDDDGAHRL